MVTQRIATPEVRDAILQCLAQVPFVHAPHHNATRRETRIVAAQPHDQALRLLLVHAALALHADAVLENQVQAIYRHRANTRIRIFGRLVHNHVNRAILAPAALAVFNKQVFAGAQRHLHDFGLAASTRGSDIHRHGLTRNRLHSLHRRPTHICAFPRRRHRGHEAIARVIARKIHHVIIAQAADTLHHVVRIGHSELAPNLVHQNAVHAPVEAILRGSLAHHHHRAKRGGDTARNAERRSRRIALARQPDYGFHKLALRGIRQKVLPVVTAYIDIHEVARSVGSLRAHATAIDQSRRPRMDNHVGAFHVRVLGKRYAERPRLRSILRRGGNRIVNESQVVAATRLVKFRRLLALLFRGAVVVDNLLVECVHRRTRRRIRENARIDDDIPTAYRLVIIIREFKMLEPVCRGSPTVRRVKAIGILFLLVGIENARTRRKRVVVLLFLELHTERKHLQSVYGKRHRRKRQAQEQGKNNSGQLPHIASIYKNHSITDL